MKHNTVLKEVLDVYKMRKNKTALIHLISNLVTMNDVAQAVNLVNAKPVMAHWEEETEEITRSSSALVINLGTPDEGRIKGIKSSARAASESGIPIVLDAVGVQASLKRRELALKLIEEYKITVLKGNYSEIKSLLALGTKHIGIDSMDMHMSEGDIEDIKSFSKKNRLIVILTGESDYIFNGTYGIRVENGTRLLSRITGSGCILSGILGGLAGKADGYDEVYSLCAYGLLIGSISGEIAEEIMIKKGEGLYSFKNYFMDGLSKVCEEEIMERGRVFSV